MDTTMNNDYVLKELDKIRITLDEISWYNKKEMAYVMGHLKRLIKHLEENCQASQNTLH